MLSGPYFGQVQLKYTPGGQGKTAGDIFGTRRLQPEPLAISYSCAGRAPLPHPHAHPHPHTHQPSRIPAPPHPPTNPDASPRRRSRRSWRPRPPSVSPIRRVLSAAPAASLPPRASVSPLTVIIRRSTCGDWGGRQVSSAGGALVVGGLIRLQIRGLRGVVCSGRAVLRLVFTGFLAGQLQIGIVAGGLRHGERRVVGWARRRSRCPPLRRVVGWNRWVTAARIPWPACRRRASPLPHPRPLSARLLFRTAAPGRGGISSPSALAAGEIFSEVAQVSSCRYGPMVH